MKQSTSTKISIAAAGVAIALASAAFGQSRVNTGNALDANNRVGSNGINGPGGSSYLQNRINNAIVSGNITGGREFRGPVGSVSPRQFRGNISGANLDRFVASSAGVTNGNFVSNAQDVRPFFGNAEAVAPPAGFAPLGGTGGYILTPPATRTGADLRLGKVFDTPGATLPRPGELLLPGQVDPTTNSARVITASPLYGVRPLSTGETADLRFLERYTNALGDDSRRPMDEATLRRMQDEIEQADPDIAKPTDQLKDAAPNDPLKSNTDSKLSDGKPLVSGVETGQEFSGKVMLSPAIKQSAQYREMQARLDKFNAGRKDGTEATRDYNEQIKLRAQVEEQARADKTKPTFQPGGTNADGTPAQPGQANTPGQPAPVGTTPTLPGTGGTGLDGSAQPALPGLAPGQLPGPTRVRDKTDRPTVTSLATGVQAKGLEQLLTEAEKLMRDQKFVSALDKYDMAEQVAPNNPLPLLGRANAELGASYYARSESHLRQAFTGAPALMMARYDLRSFLGDDRLSFLVKDLKEIANTEKASARPLILLAYIAYNDGNDRMAAGYLDLAEKRVGTKDGFFDSVRQHWELPAYDPAAAAPDNK